MKTPSKIAIVLLNWNGKNDTLECLSSLKKLDYPHIDIILVDNGSKDDSVAAFQKAFPEIPLIQTFANLGFAGGNNGGILHALRRGADFILLLNNDTIIDPSLITSFLKAAQSKPEGGIFGAKILRYHEKETIDHIGGVWNPRIAEFESLGRGLEKGTISEMANVDYVCGCALFARKEVFEKVGMLESDFFLLWEETDFCFRAKKAGFEIWTVPDALVWHKISASFSGKALMHYYWWRGRLLWIERNCNLQKKISLYAKVLLKEMWKIHKLCLLKSAQHFLEKFLFPQKMTEKKKLTLKRYQAGCKGIRDYFFRKFGGPVEDL